MRKMDQSAAPVKTQKVRYASLQCRHHQTFPSCSQTVLQSFLHASFPTDALRCVTAGQTYAFEEQPVGMYGQAFTISKAEPKSETLTLTQCRRHVTVFKSYQLPDRIAAAKAMGAVMPSAEMPGISGIISTQSAEEGAIPPVQPPDESLIQKQQEQVKRHSAHDQLFVTPKDSKQQRKQAKSETKKLAKRAQEHTAVNEEHRKLQRVADVPLIAPDMLQVTAEPEVISQATLKQQGTWKPSPSSKNNLAPLKEEYKPVKDQDEDGKTKRVKKRDGNVTVTTTIDLSGLSD